MYGFYFDNPVEDANEVGYTWTNGKKTFVVSVNYPAGKTKIKSKTGFSLSLNCQETFWEGNPTTHYFTLVSNIQKRKNK